MEVRRYLGLARVSHDEWEEIGDGQVNVHATVCYVRNDGHARCMATAP